ncbi:MAG: prolyl oligopeptidase family serine peptidase [Gammaproteobacteria bacterium]|nr:prolyl oligopeptidase family serine peptidase [Gammaproteobacteria bacterium]MYE80401.1 prolyl oligopeptidase family serine peptidase [Gammaproteobacteria bacterium]
MLPLSQRDLRSTRLYREVHAYYDAICAPGQDRVTDGADLAADPRGQLAGFTGIVFQDLETAPVTRICLVDLASGTTSRLHCPANSDRMPCWSPDGSRLAFLSDRAEPGNFQLILADREGKGPTRATPAVDGTVEYFHWSPDGQRIVLGVAGFGADLPGALGAATTAAKADALPEWMPEVETADAENLWRRLYVYDTGTNALRRASPEGLNCWESGWLGNRQLIAVASDSHSEGSWYRCRLHAIDPHTTSARTIYTPSDQIGLPAASPSGEVVALVEAVCSDRLVVAGQLLLIEPQTGESRTIDTHDVDVTHLVWRDDTHLVFAGHRGFETVVSECRVDSGAVREHWAGIERTMGAWYPTVSPLPGGRCAAICEGYAVPPELVVLADGESRPVASLGTVAGTAPDFHRASVEPFTWQARDGLEMQGWLVRPEAPGPHPLVMDIHGGPVWASRNRWHGRLRGTKALTDHGCAVFYPNPRGSSGRGQAFARLVVGDMGGEDTHDYLTGLDALVERGIADAERLGVTGISYGGYASAWLITQDSRFAAAAPISPCTNWYSQHRTSQIPQFDEMFLGEAASVPGGRFHDRSPVMYADRVTTPTLILAGGADQSTPPGQALEFHRSLLEHGVESVLATYPKAGHGVRSFPEVVDATTRYVGWFLQHLGCRQGP